MAAVPTRIVRVRVGTTCVRSALDRMSEVKASDTTTAMNVALIRQSSGASSGQQRDP
jgi:hypothetical protein